jgi:hypothetical protein
MHPKPILSPGDADAQDQAAVMTLLLTEHPAQLTRAEIERELAPTGEFGETDAMARAIRDLAAVGLLNVAGSLVLPSRAAFHFDSLDCGRP